MEVLHPPLTSDLASHALPRARHLGPRSPDCPPPRSPLTKDLHYGGEGTGNRKPYCQAACSLMGEAQSLESSPPPRVMGETETPHTQGPAAGTGV